MCHCMCYFSTPAVETPDNLPFPDGEEVSPEIRVETLPGNGCHSNSLEIQLTSITQYVHFSIRQYELVRNLSRLVMHMKRPFHLCLWVWNWKIMSNSTHGNNIRVSLWANLPYFSDRSGWVCLVPETNLPFALLWTKQKALSSDHDSVMILVNVN